MILFEDLVKQAIKLSEGPLGNVAFGDENDYPQLAKLQGKKPGSEPNDRIENELSSALEDWTSDSKGVDKTLHKHKNIILKAKEDYPQIFEPNTPNGTVTYRGLKGVNQDLLNKLRKTEYSDWTPIQAGKFMLYKKDISYRPRGVVQSFTTDVNVAVKNFVDEALIITKQNDEFAMNQKAMHVFFSGGSKGVSKSIYSEKEILHFGKTFSNKVYIAVIEETFNWEIKKYIVGKNKTKIGDISRILYPTED